MWPLKYWKLSLATAIASDLEGEEYSVGLHGTWTFPRLTCVSGDVTSCNLFYIVRHSLVYISRRAK